MSEHAGQDSHGHAGAAHSSGDGLRFEKSELEFFVDDDRDTGAKIGKLLALIFCVLLVLMSGVAWWTNINQYASQDPLDVPVMTTTAGGH